MIRRIPRYPTLVFLLSLVFLPTHHQISAQEYSVFGEISVETGYRADYRETPAAAGDNRLDSLMEVELNHRFDYERFSFIAHHRAGMNGEEELDHTLNEAYIDFRPADAMRLGVGKQRIAWGRGITFFPTDTLHPSHTRDDVEGFTGASTLFTPNPDLQLTGVVDFSAPLSSEPGTGANEDFVTNLKYALYGSLFLGNLDLALSGVYRRNETLRPGLGFSYDLTGFILTAEGAIEFLNQTLYPAIGTASFREADRFEPYPLFAAGISRSWMPEALTDYTFYAAAEYLYAGTGYTRAEERRFFEIDPGFATTAYLGQQYLFLLASLEIYQTISLEISGLTNLQDRSANLAGTITLLTIDGIDLSAEGTRFVGDTNTEFDAMGRQSGELIVSLKARLYF